MNTKHFDEQNDFNAYVKICKIAYDLMKDDGVDRVVVWDERVGGWCAISKEDLKHDTVL